MSLTQVTGNPDWDINPSLSPDGQFIAFQSSRSGNFEIYSIDMGNWNIMRLTNDVAYDGFPAWKP